MRFVKIIAGECVLFSRTLTILHLHMYRKTVQHFESKESIGNVCVHITNPLFFRRSHQVVSHTTMQIHITRTRLRCIVQNIMHLTTTFKTTVIARTLSCSKYGTFSDEMATNLWELFSWR